MKALSLWQPWASAIEHGNKLIETRSWQTPHRGKLLIHAAKSLKGKEYLYDDVELWCSVLGPGTRGILAGKDGDKDMMNILPRGALLAMANLVGCELITPGHAINGSLLIHGTARTYSMTDQERALGNYQPGRYAWILEDITPLPKPIPYKGRQGLFEVPDELVKL